MDLWFPEPHIGKYLVMTWLSWSWFWLGLIKYPPGAFQPRHKDPVPMGRRHFKINLVLQKAQGGEFKSQTPVWQWGRLMIFRPDLVLHEVTPKPLTQNKLGGAPKLVLLKLII